MGLFLDQFQFQISRPSTLQADLLSRVYLEVTEHLLCHPWLTNPPLTLLNAEAAYQED